jgi:hypothetical protein
VESTSVPLAPGIKKYKTEKCDNRERSVFIASRMLTGRPRNLGSVTGRSRVLSVPHTVCTGCERHLTSYPKFTEGFLFRVNFHLGKVKAIPVTGREGP